MNLITALKYPMVTKVVQEFLVVSIPDFEITVSEALPVSNLQNDYVTLISKLQNRALNKVIEKLSRLEEVKKSHYRPPSFIRQTIQIEKKDTMSTKEAAIYLGVSERTLRRWETDCAIKATKTRGGHRSFNLGELDRVKAVMVAGEKPLNQNEENLENMRVQLEKLNISLASTR